MKMLLLNTFDAYAGSQRIGRDMVRLLAAAGHDVQVRLGFGGGGFLRDLSETRTDVGISNVAIRKLLYPLWALLVSLPVAIAALRGRIIWANAVYATLPALLAALLCPHRVAVHLHEATFPKLFMMILRLMVWRGVLIICVSSDHAARIGLPATVLYNPVSLSHRDAPSACDRLLFVGTTQPIKGFALFVAVCDKLEALPLRKTAYLSDEARHDRTLVARARQAGIDVVFGESRPEVLYRDGFLLLQTTDSALWTETFSLVAVEAMARLVPVAGTGTTVLPEVLGEALAFNAPSRDPREIADAIRSLHANPAQHAALRSACASHRGVFSECAFLNRLENIVLMGGRQS
ncbi:glycosyltransferase [Sphingomonas radiodurans]|uniref:glycosyltransferase n=1 Tax=Sphingomonas radiodurans TaxID=2890321 RepID=UPI001E366831|nr:glycosyltransferase [Sphingomonas radiodurans]WBH15104.1 glycosyltransferase [Sphingomonas radiodurans]